MSNNLVTLPFRGRDNGGGQGQNGGSPPEGPSMESRVAALEARLDSTLPNLSTKADLAEVRTEIHQSTAQMIKWVAGTGIAVASILVSAFIALSAKIDKPAAPLQQASAPIIIQVPAYQPPAPPPQAPTKQ